MPRDPGEFQPQRLFAFELRGGKTQLGRTGGDLSRRHILECPAAAANPSEDRLPM
jgi:hypothetical protein